MVRMHTVGPHLRTRICDPILPPHPFMAPPPPPEDKVYTTESRNRQGGLRIQELLHQTPGGRPATTHSTHT